MNQKDFKDKGIDSPSNNNLNTFPSVSNIKTFGMGGIKLLVTILFTFGLLNTVFLLVSFISVLGSNEKDFVALIATFVLGSAFTSFAFFKCYRHTLNKGLKIIYSHTIPFFKKLCERIIDYTDSIASDTINLKSIHIDKAFDLGDMLYSMYGNTVPSFAKKGINILISKIPFNDFLFEIKDSIRERNKGKASTALFYQVDSYISSILESGSLKMLYLIFILNLIAQTIVLVYL